MGGRQDARPGCCATPRWGPPVGAVAAAGAHRNPTAPVSEPRYEGSPAGRLLTVRCSGGGAWWAGPRGGRSGPRSVRLR